MKYWNYWRLGALIWSLSAPRRKKCLWEFLCLEQVRKTAVLVNKMPHNSLHKHQTVQRMETITPLDSGSGAWSTQHFKLFLFHFANTHPYWSYSLLVLGPLDSFFILIEYERV